MGAQKNSVKTTRKTSKSEVSSEVSKKGTASNVKLGSSSKKTTKSQTALPSKPMTKIKGSNEVNSQQPKNSNFVNGKSATKGKSLQGGSSLKKAFGGGRFGQDSGLAVGETVCREVACEGLATSGGYCRLHYIKNWKKIKRKEVILREKKLNQYIEELVVKYPDKYIEAIRQDLANDKDFAKVIYDLDLDEAVDDFDVEGGDSVDSLIDTIKRDFEDDGDAF